MLENCSMTKAVTQGMRSGWFSPFRRDSLAALVDLHVSRSDSRVSKSSESRRRSLEVGLVSELDDVL